MRLAISTMVFSSCLAADWRRRLACSVLHASLTMSKPVAIPNESYAEHVSGVTPTFSEVRKWLRPMRWHVSSVSLGVGWGNRI